MMLGTLPRAQLRYVKYEPCVVRCRPRERGIVKRFRICGALLAGCTASGIRGDL
jgi:hypothetical protein